MPDLEAMRQFLARRWQITQAVSGMNYGILTLNRDGTANLVDPLVGLDGVPAPAPQLVSEGAWEVIEGFLYPHETGCELTIRGFTMQMGEMAGATLSYRIATIAEGAPKFVSLLDGEDTAFLLQEVA